MVVMAKISYVKEIDKSGLLRLGIVRGEESFSYIADAKLYARLGKPDRGSEISDEMLCMLAESDNRIKAKRQALSILSFADNNEKGLFMKLRRRGFDSEVARQTVEEMVELGYINEQRQLERIIAVEANGKLRGPRKIISSLVAKGYPSELVKKVLRNLCDEGEIDFSENAERLIEKKLSDPENHEQRKALLFKNGF